MNLTPFVILWALLGIATLALALYRKLVMLHQEDELVHLGAGEERMIPHQVALAHKMDVVDKWGKILTVLTVVYGLAMAAFYLYEQVERGA
ncbi:MAG: hypothetical protein ABSB35_21560 [Bryobacteraceae bacterium]|jgi:hypothetical protein